MMSLFMLELNKRLIQIVAGCTFLCLFFQSARVDTCEKCISYFDAYNNMKTLAQFAVNVARQVWGSSHSPHWREIMRLKA